MKTVPAPANTTEPVLVPSNIPYMSAIQPADSAVWDVATVLQPAVRCRYTWILTTLLPVDDDKCVACGACVKACPRNIIELRNKGPKDRRVFVSCVNKDKGGVARKACKAACIGCGKCAKECPFDAITVENNLAYIDYSKCRLCRKCVGVCPTGAIHEVNFPPRKTETEAEKNQQTTIKPTNSCATSGQTATDPVGKAPVSASPQVESIEAQKTPETDSKN